MAKSRREYDSHNAVWTTLFGRKFARYCCQDARCQEHNLFGQAPVPHAGRDDGLERRSRARQLRGAVTGFAASIVSGDGHAGERRETHSRRRKGGAPFPSAPFGCTRPVRQESAEVCLRLHPLSPPKLVLTASHVVPCVRLPSTSRTDIKRTTWTTLLFT